MATSAHSHIGDSEPDNFHVVPSYSDDEESPLVQDNDHLNHESDEQDDEKPQQPPFEWHPAVLAVARVAKQLLTPVVRFVFAPRAQRMLIKSIVIGIVILWILLTSIAAYLTFYRQYVPRLAHIEPVYFEYVSDSPTGRVDLQKNDLLPPLRHEQAYDVSLQLHVPTSDINFDLGNFMVSVWLTTKDNENLAYASRPAILRYQSKTLRILHVIAKGLPLLLGLTEESQIITVPLIEGYTENRARPVTGATVALSSSKVQVYDARIRVLADFHGLRYYMYHRRIPTAIGFILLFIAIELVCAAVAWKYFGQNVWVKLSEAYDQPGLIDDEQHEPQHEEEEEGTSEERHLTSERDHDDDEASSYST